MYACLVYLKTIDCKLLEQKHHVLPFFTWWKAVSYYLKQSPRLSALLGCVSKVYNGPFFPRGSLQSYKWMCNYMVCSSNTIEVQCKTNNHSPLNQGHSGKVKLQALVEQSRDLGLCEPGPGSLPWPWEQDAIVPSVWVHMWQAWKCILQLCSWMAHTALWSQIPYKVN